MENSWQCEPCGLSVKSEMDCPRCGAKPPSLLAIGLQLHFTGVCIPKED